MKIGQKCFEAKKRVPVKSSGGKELMDRMVELMGMMVVMMSGDHHIQYNQILQYVF